MRSRFTSRLARKSPRVSEPKTQRTESYTATSVPSGYNVSSIAVSSMIGTPTSYCETIISLLFKSASTC